MYIFDSYMDNSQFETSTNNALLQIQRAQRVLDEAQSKMKRFKKEKQSASKIATFDYMSSPLPDLKQYLEYLINQEHQPEENNEEANQRYKKLQTTAQIRQKTPLVSSNSDKELNNYKKTEKAQRTQSKQHALYDRTPLHANTEFLDLKKHTQQQLQKSSLVRLEKIQAMYKEQFDTLDTKIEGLLKNRDKIKKDKLLLLRDNEELQQKIELQRAKKINTLSKIDSTDERTNELRAQVLKLQKKLAKIQMENSKIVKRKQELEINMRVCIRNSKEMLEGEIAGTRLRENKSKSTINYKCPYH